MQCLTKAYNPDSPEHQDCKRDIELGNGLPGIRTTAEVDAALKTAGYEVLLPPWRFHTCGPTWQDPPHNNGLVSACRARAHSFIVSH